MTSYVIRGGAEGKARLSVLAAALAPSTAALLDSVGLCEGMRCLDLGCGGGDVTRAMARVVGRAGTVVGVDMDAAKLALAQRDAQAEGVESVEFRCEDATALDGRDMYDLVYARFLLTHLVDPALTLRAMVGAVRPGGTVVVEDLDHSAVFSYPASPVLDRYVALYNETARGRGGDPEIGPKLAGMMRRAGLVDVQVGLVQPVFVDGPAKRIHEITLANVRDAVLLSEAATPEALDAMAADLATLCDDRDTLVAFPRVFQVAGRRDG